MNMINIRHHINDLTSFMRTEVYASLYETTKSALVRKKVELCGNYFLDIASYLNRNKYRGCYAPHMDMDVMNMASRRRNPVLADIFSRLKYMERRGSGFRKIMSAYKGHDGYAEGMNPTFSTPWNSFVLTLPKFNIDGVEGVYISSDDITDHGGQTGGQTGVDTTIAEVLRLIKENPQITRKILSETIGVSSSAIQKHINRLKAESVIRRVGGDYGGYWEVLNASSV